MKKFSVILMAILITVFGAFFSACEKKESNAKIELDKSSVSIYLGETENNTVVVRATTIDFSTEMLVVKYDNTNIDITPRKTSDNTFDLIVSSKVTIGTNPIIVEVSAKGAEANFSVELVVPVEQIVAEQNLYVPYDNQSTMINLYDHLTFYPTGTKQTGVTFSLAEESSNFEIKGNYLEIKAGLLSEGSGLDFGEEVSVVVDSVSSEEGKSDVATEMVIKIVPNIKWLAKEIDVKVETDSASFSNFENKTYELNVAKSPLDGSYDLGTFKTQILIPAELGIDVDVDKNFSIMGGQPIQNISNILQYDREYTQESLINGGATRLYDKYVFIFRVDTLRQGVGCLSFKYTYKNYNESGLETSYAFYDNTTSAIVSSINVSVSMPITEIDFSTTCNQTSVGASVQYHIYQNYSNDVLGGKFIFSALPYGTIQNNLCIKILKGGYLRIFDKTGREITEYSNQDAVYIT
ncbi:MAG: hypothetical protein E7378_00490 [Clostridiales bacterium]|nr:hypothetical protein [Clostridiales bacterium]